MHTGNSNEEVWEKKERAVSILSKCSTSTTAVSIKLDKSSGIKESTDGFGRSE